ncbi:MAG: reverse transcriptase domain-containing protein [Hyphomicrobiaceae bacterium]
MAKLRRKHTDLFGRIVSFNALLIAARKAVKGKRKKPGAASFFANLERELLRLERELREGTYRPGRYVEIMVRDPKERLVSAAPFRDRVVHHALCAIIYPIFEAGFIGNNFANRTGKGTHAAIRIYERHRDNQAHVLRADIYRYFPSIDHAILKGLFRRRIACEQTLALMDTIVDASNTQEPVELHFPGDDLFEPYRRRRGLPIGNLTSQFFANLYLDRFDHWVSEKLGMHYVRYVDDFALFHDDPGVLADWRAQIERYLEGRRLKLHPCKTVILPTSEPAAFLGFELRAGSRQHAGEKAGRGQRRLPEDNVARFRNRLRGLRDRWRQGTVSKADVEARIAAWIAHASHADTFRLRQAMFEDGWFEPMPGVR